MSDRPIVGFVGLGSMGAILAGNLVEHGLTVVAHDVAGPDRAPAGSTFVDDLAEVARRTEVVVLSLPDGGIGRRVVGGLLAAAGRTFTHVIDTTTAGPHDARAIDALLGAAGIGFVDAPVSGGTAGARARTLTVMVAGNDASLARVEPVLAGLSDRRIRVGAVPGMAQTMKLANNFLSATALAATSEAIAFGVAMGLDMDVMLQVLNASSGQSSATIDKFPNHVLTGRYASGFANSLMAKDVRLYLTSVSEQGAPSEVGAVTERVWTRFAESDPGADFTAIYRFVAEG